MSNTASPSNSPSPFNNLNIPNSSSAYHTILPAALGPVLTSILSSSYAPPTANPTSSLGGSMSSISSPSKLILKQKKKTIELNKIGVLTRKYKNSWKKSICNYK